MENVLEPAMTVRDVAALLNVDEKTIYRLVTKGEIPGFKVLGSWRFQRHDLLMGLSHLGEYPKDHQKVCRKFHPLRLGGHDGFSH